MTYPASTPGVDDALPVEGEVLDRPEPVLDAGKLAGLVAAVVVAVVGLVLIVAAGVTLDDLTPLGQALAGVATAVAAVVAYVAPVWQARKARARVTPLADPRDAAGEPLVTGADLIPLDGALIGRATVVEGDVAEPYVVVPQTPGEADHAAPE